MTISDAYSQHPLPGFDTNYLTSQQAAFDECLRFARRLSPTKTTNRRRTSSKLKHIVENPAGNFGIQSKQDCSFGYVYEGTFVLAALEAGLTPTFREAGLTATFNYTERSLQDACRELVASRLQAG